MICDDKQEQASKMREANNGEKEDSVREKIAGVIARGARCTRHPSDFRFRASIDVFHAVPDKRRHYFLPLASYLHPDCLYRSKR